MRITSNILGNLAGALKKSLVGMYETDIMIPPTATTFISPRECLRQFNPAAATINQSTFHISGGLRVANAALAQANLTTLDIGLWEIELVTRYSSNYASGLNGGQLTIFVNSFTGALVDMGTEVALGADIFLHRKFNLSLDFQLTFGHVLQNNGVGNAHSIESFIMCSKLL